MDVTERCHHAGAQRRRARRDEQIGVVPRPRTPAVSIHAVCKRRPFDEHRANAGARERLDNRAGLGASQQLFAGCRSRLHRQRVKDILRPVVARVGHRQPVMNQRRQILRLADLRAARRQACAGPATSAALPATKSRRVAEIAREKPWIFAQYTAAKNDRMSGITGVWNLDGQPDRAATLLCWDERATASSRTRRRSAAHRRRRRVRVPAQLGHARRSWRAPAARSAWQTRAPCWSSTAVSTIAPSSSPRCTLTIDAERRRPGAAAYDAWGAGFAERLNGDFACAIFDSRARAAPACARCHRRPARSTTFTRRACCVRVGDQGAARTSCHHAAARR